MSTSVGVKTSFQKRTGTKPTIPGVRPSIANQQLLTSSGLKIVDKLLHADSGLPVGSVVLIRENGRRCPYSSLVVKYFLSQGVCDCHGLFLISPPYESSSSSYSSAKFVDNLPNFSSTATTYNSAKKESKPEPDQDLRIAWRYKNDKNNPEESRSSSTASFDLRNTIPKNELEERSEVTTMDVDDDFSYRKLLLRIREAITESLNRKYSLEDSDSIKKISVMRIAILDLGSILYGPRDSVELRRFIMALKSLCRSYLCVAFIQMNGEDDVEAVETVVDSVLELESFEGNPSLKKLFKNHHGTIRLTKSANVNRICGNDKIYSKYLFKSLRTGFAFELMTLPPDLSEIETPAKPNNHRNIDF